MKETMTPRERWLAVLNRQKPDRVPMDYWATAEATQKLLKHLGCDQPEMLRRLHIDQPFSVGGRYIGPAAPEGQDIWGSRFVKANYGTGSYDEAIAPPLARFTSVAEIEAEYRWPLADHWDYSHLSEAIKGQEHRPIRGGGSEPFLHYKRLRGEEQGYMDLIEYPEIVEYCLGKLFDLAYEGTRRIIETIPA